MLLTSELGRQEASFLSQNPAEIKEPQRFSAASAAVRRREYEAVRRLDPKHREYMREYGRRWIAKRRAAYFSGKVCVECGGAEKLEIHHVDPSQKEASAIWSWSEPRRLAELAKCIVLCDLCHEKLHGDLLRKPIVHGTSNAYRIKGCKCAECRAWNCRRNQEGRKRRASAKLSEVPQPANTNATEETP